MTSTDAPARKVSVSRVIAADPATIFDVLADPAQHPIIDGSGTVKQAKGNPERLSLGARFGMDMKIGLPYSTSNTVIELEENRRIAWQTLAEGPLKTFVGGRIWRYELEPVEGGTLVTETWDISEEAAVSKPFVRRMEGMTRTNMAATLERIEELVTA